MKIEVYDTTLRDGTQGEHVNLTVQDKVKIAHRLDEMHFDYIEGGWPGSNPKDIEFFERAQEEEFHHARIAAFGSTRRANNPPEDDANLNLLIRAQTPVITIFGKTWDLHVERAIRVSRRDNLKMIADSVAYLKAAGRFVIYDAEHYFDGWKDNPEYALRTLVAADEAGADLIVLCDTNGGCLPDEIAKGTRPAKKAVRAKLGIHTHNDGALAVANALAAVKAGASHVQGTINGYGERCGNVDLCALVANLQLKLGYQCLPDDSLQKLSSLSHFVDEVANLVSNSHQPFVGDSAFAHKGGVHVDAVMKHARTYEHITPESVGNRRRVLVSELSGSSNIRYRAAQFGVELKKGSPEVADLLSRLKQLEHEGYEFEAADASFELLVRRTVGKMKRPYTLKKLHVTVEKYKSSGRPTSDAILKMRVRGRDVYVGAEGDGPVHALDSALRKALREFYPQLDDIHLTDFKVRVVSASDGTGAKVRVLLESTCNGRSWTTVGVSANIIEASWQALSDSVEFGLLHYDEFMANGE